jgi:hypothetical protein
MVPAKADWSFNRWLMKSRMPALPVVHPVVIVAVAAAPVAAVQAAGVVVVPVAAMIVIVVAVVAVMAIIRSKPVAKNWLKSWFTSTAFPKP